MTAVEVSRHTEDGTWHVAADAAERRRLGDYLDALPRYLNSFEPLFSRAKCRDEFQFIVALLGIYGLQDAGWVPYESTEAGVRAATRIHNETADPEAARHLKLWIYGHIVEASAPYDLLANAIQIARGEPAQRTWFPDEGGRPVSPGSKIERLGAWARTDGHADVERLLADVWDRNLRNAIFHADYALHGAEVRLPAVGEVWTGDQIEGATGKASAYHDAVSGLRRFHRQSYSEPKRISAASFSPDPNEEAIVIVREGEGAVGLKDGFAVSEIAAGAIPFRLAKLFPDEREALDANHDLALLPARPGRPV
jgi:hypothetical protein